MQLCNFHILCLSDTLNIADQYSILFLQLIYQAILLSRSTFLYHALTI